MLDSRLYVVHYTPSISVYDAKLNYNKIKEINLDGFIELGNSSGLLDIVVYNEMQLLFACDWNKKRIIRLNVNNSIDSPVTVWIQMDYKPTKMSILSRRLLVTPDTDMGWQQRVAKASGRNCLYLYDLVSSELVKRVPLTNDMITLHAVETHHSTFVVCQRDREDDRHHNQVRE